MPKYLKVGGRVMVAVALAADAYEIYTASDRGKTVLIKVAGWTGALMAGSAGTEIGAASGASVGAFFFGAGAVPGGVISGIGGGILGGAGGYFFGTKMTEKLYDDIIEAGFSY